MLTCATIMFPKLETMLSIGMAATVAPLLLTTAGIVIQMGGGTATEAMEPLHTAIMGAPVRLMFGARVEIPVTPADVSK